MSHYRADHWDGVYSRSGEASVSWFQEVPVRACFGATKMAMTPGQAVAQKRPTELLHHHGDAGWTVPDPVDSRL